MRLCEEYLLRNSLTPRYARHVRKGFLYFDHGERLLASEWISLGPRPGYYEISECSLGRTCKTLNSSRVEWDEYEPYLVEWAKNDRRAVFDKGRVFSLTWEYFLRRHDKDLAGLLPLSDLYKTVDESNESRLVDCFSLLESLSSLRPSIVEFWKTRAFEIVSSYCYWMKEL